MAKTITITALDIGTSSIKVLVGQKKLGSDSVSILAKIDVPCFGVRKGEVFNSGEVARAVSNVKQHLQKLNIGKIKKVLINIGGSHIFSFPSQGLVSVSRADQKISQEDIQRAFKASEAIKLPLNKEVLDVQLTEFIVDGERGIEDPLGLQGIRLETKVLLICVFSPILQNLEEAITEADFEIEEIIPSPLAVSRAILTPQQKELGVAAVDIGGGTTSLSVFSEGKLRDFVIFSIGSSNITSDIAIGLRTEIATAEKIKREFGSLNSIRKKSKKSKIEIPEKSLSFPQDLLRNIIESRVSQIFFELQKELKRISKQTLLPAGVIFTGGGSLLPGLQEFAKKNLFLPCYLSGPKGITGVEDPSFSTCSGLLLSGFDSEEEDETTRGGEGPRKWLRKIVEIFGT